ncbi:MAG: UDP-N-acetylmuramoyl-tripeptide--D-alanyl-D-alanine ligase [Firmicutes bacterium]|nr:UDP-N-acetylmuramoyl-tripeptide--D-alanyl-D-alanine ligase [Bacillota bacterium]MCL1953466.1 UDP-N-acetylmuramoyl-tripeptide--D-alanyl-D-alanine ligase [Bacillota bacterium]
MKYIDYTVWGVDGIELFFVILMLLTTVFLLSVLSYKILQILQLGGYRLKEFKLWYKSFGFTIFFRFCFLSFLICLGSLMYISAFGDKVGWRYLGFIFFVVLSLLFIKFSTKDNKTPLKKTPRIVRLYITTVVLYVIVVLIFSFIPTGILEYAHFGLLPLFIIPIVLLAHLINKPIEIKINQGYIYSAKSKLSTMPDLTIVGITGSFGKTTTKNILTSLLSLKYRVCSTPSSFNTPMGICKTINNDLNDSHQVLILEMGARYKGDILELLEIASPKIAIITSIGNQHLTTFGNYDTVLDTKFEIVSQLPQDGIAILDGTNPDIVARSSEIEQAILVGSDNSQFKCGNINTTQYGTSFELHLQNQVLQLSTQILGRHVPNLIALCVATSISMGITDLNYIADAISKLEPIPHRLQLLQGVNDNVIIDNAYSSNLCGATNALEILSSFADRIKIIITPGIVEQGDKTQNTNIELGIEIAKVCDYAILIGTNATYIKNGIEQYSNHTKIILVDTLKLAIDSLSSIVGKKATLFENDLPDNMV